jgi:prevent-host-death family protein
MLWRSVRQEAGMVEIVLSEAEAALSNYIDAALRGEDVVITRAGERLVRLAPVVESGSSRPRIVGPALLENITSFRDRLAAEAPRPEAADIDADLLAMRGRD